MEDGLTRPNVCRNMKLPPSTLSTMMRNANEIEPSMQHIKAISATRVPHSSSKILQTKMEKLFLLWMDDLNNKISVDSNCYDATVKKVQCKSLTVLFRTYTI